MVLYPLCGFLFSSALFPSEYRVWHQKPGLEHLKIRKHNPLNYTMTRCAMATCDNTYKKAKKEGHLLSLHSFPRDCKLRDKWIAACRRDDEWNPLSSHVCSDHFTPDDFEADQRLQIWTGVKWKPKLKPGAIPSVQLPRNVKPTMNENTSKKLIPPQNPMECVGSPEISDKSSRSCSHLERKPEYNSANREKSLYVISILKKQSECVRKRRRKKDSKKIIVCDQNVIHSGKDFEIYECKPS
ncbi:hypothetical protein GE061_007332 [Apolygus lucorum]|uniref:THAP-type domain-containing protein n=1 Tax=Apolygus lucorum TaxID=248454 RepID=A0A8S9WU03_APOLU|nr:hypothetical protein GE061_007332 [Apolygus lucorum]